MIIYHSNYAELADFTSALESSLATDGDIYVTRAEYDLARTCQLDEYFVNVLQHQYHNTACDSDLWSGFEGYVAPEAEYGITYIDGLFTTVGAGSPVTYNPGDVLSITIDSASVSLEGVSIEIIVLGDVYSSVANSSGSATFSVTLLESTTGDITITSQLGVSATNIRLGYHAEDWPESYGSMDGFSFLSLGGYAVGDADDNNSLTVADHNLAQIAHGTLFRLKTSNLFTVSLGAVEYYPELNNYSTLTYTVTPATVDYASIEGTSQYKALSDISWNVVVGDIGDASPLVKEAITGASASLNGDGTYSGSLLLSSEYIGDLAVVFTALEALNTASMSTLTLDTTVISLESGSLKFEPGDNLVFRINSPGTGIDYENTAIFLESTDGEFSGTIAVPEYGTNTTFNVAVPTTLDHTIEIVASISAFVTNNRVIAFSDSSPSFFQSYTAVLASPYYNDSTQISLTVAATGGSTPAGSVYAKTLNGTILAWDSEPGSGPVGTYTLVPPASSGNITIFCTLT